MLPKTTRVFAIGFLFAAVLVSGACSKSDSTPAKTKTQLLTTSSWKLTAHTVNPAMDLDGDGQKDDTDVFALGYEACSKDDTYSFHTDFTGIVDEGPTKCDASDPQSTPVEWLFKNNETVLQIKQDIIALDFTIVELTETTLKVTYSQTDSGVTVTQTITYTH
jgi:hypothetical protein